MWCSREYNILFLYFLHERRKFCHFKLFLLHFCSSNELCYSKLDHHIILLLILLVFLKRIIIIINSVFKRVCFNESFKCVLHWITSRVLFSIIFDRIELVICWSCRVVIRETWILGVIIIASMCLWDNNNIRIVIMRVWYWLCCYFLNISMTLLFFYELVLLWWINRY